MKQKNQEMKQHLQQQLDNSLIPQENVKITVSLVPQENVKITVSLVPQLQLWNAY